MPRKNPWHSVHSMVHHNNSGCLIGRKILLENQRPGSAGKYLCGQCRRLNHKEIAQRAGLSYLPGAPESAGTPHPGASTD